MCEMELCFSYKYTSDYRYFHMPISSKDLGNIKRLAIKVINDYGINLADIDGIYASFDDDEDSCDNPWPIWIFEVDLCQKS